MRRAVFLLLFAAFFMGSPVSLASQGSIHWNDYFFERRNDLADMLKVKVESFEDEISKTRAVFAEQNLKNLAITRAREKQRILNELTIRIYMSNRYTWESVRNAVAEVYEALGL